MNRFRKLLIRVLPLALLLLCVSAAAIFALTRAVAVPDNPLTKAASPSRMLLSGGDSGLGTETDIDFDLPETTDFIELQREQTDWEIHSEETLPQTEPHNWNEADSSLEPEVSRREETVPQTHNESGEPAEPPEEISVTDTETAEDGTGDVNPERPGDDQTPSGGITAEEYFTTSITNGAVLTSKEYSFTITHLKRGLTVKTEVVSVNEIRQPQFHGSVLLREGWNTIRISVTYLGEEGKQLSVFREYSVCVDLGEIIITTDLTEGNVHAMHVKFRAEASLNGKKLSLSAVCNGKALSAENSVYTALLKSGENEIVLTASESGRCRTARFRIFNTVPDEFCIVTDLRDETVHQEMLQFTAEIANGSSYARLTVVCNGETITVSDGSYRATLKTGGNVIRLKATDTVDGERLTITEVYTVKYVPLATEETAPKLKTVNLAEEGTSVRGDRFILAVLPEDYQGSRIYSDGIQVRLNGEAWAHKWESDVTRYLFYLRSGSNTVDIRITDRDGRYVDYSYTITCTAVRDGDPIGEMIFSLDAKVLGLGYFIEPMKVTVYQGETGAETVVRVIEERGFAVEYENTVKDGFYLVRIRKDGICREASIPQELVNAINQDGLVWVNQCDENSLGAFDYCMGAGWMYSHNGYFPDIPLSDNGFIDGDVVCVRFTLAYGKDIGGSDVGGGAGNYDKAW